jgi:hypothetical protein
MVGSVYNPPFIVRLFITLFFAVRLLIERFFT